LQGALLEISYPTIDGAGIVLVDALRHDTIVSLVTHDGLIDLTKGSIEPSETPIACALRESYEESGIDDISFVWGTRCIIVEPLIMYVAQTSQLPRLVRNQKTKVFEHLDVKMLTFSAAYKNILPYLKPVILWAHGIVNKRT
jgi:8-oxo-dGTP pyrophosphatase MutT (NUDIX family)